MSVLSLVNSCILIILWYSSHDFLTLLLTTTRPTIHNSMSSPTVHQVCLFYFLKRKKTFKAFSNYKRERRFQFWKSWKFLKFSFFPDLFCCKNAFRNLATFPVKFTLQFEFAARVNQKLRTFRTTTTPCLKRVLGLWGKPEKKIAKLA